MPDEEPPSWLENTSLNAIGILTLDTGQHLTVELIAFDEDTSELVVDVIFAHPTRDPERRTIPSSRIIAFNPQPRAAQPWPHSDPCRNSPFSFARFALMTTIFLSMIGGGIALGVILADRPYGLQITSLITYTFAELFLTFAATRSWRRFLFTCPAVKPQLPRLLLRHLAFLFALVLLQTAALAIRHHLPDWWNAPDKKGMPHFDIVLLFTCIGVALVQVYLSRSVLERAHRDFSA